MKTNEANVIHKNLHNVSCHQFFFYILVYFAPKQ